MDGRKRIWPRVASAFVVTIAVGIVWAMVLLWGGYFFMSFAPTDQVYEGIEVMRDGTPVIQSRANFNPLETTYRTLDGKPLVVPSDDRFVPGASFSAPVKPPGLFETSVPWTVRIAGVSDVQRPPVSWYLVRDEEPIGRAYFTGYDQTTKLPVGYIGRGGYSRAKPARDQWFDVGRDQLTYGSGALVNSSSVEWARKVYSYSGGGEDAHVPIWLAFMVDGDRVLMVDLRARTVQPFYQTAGLMAIAMLYEAPAEAATKPAAVAAPPKEPDGLAPATDAPESKPLLTRIAVRSAEHIAIFNWPGKSKRDFQLPESMRDQDFIVNSLPSGELLVNWSNNSRKTTMLTWLLPDGTVAREREVTLTAYAGEDEQTAAWMAAAVAPIPVGWAAVLSVIAPLSMIQSNQVASYGEAMAKVSSPSILPLVAIAVCGLLLAWVTFRIQRKYHRRANGVWVTFVLLLGLPGFLAYLIEHRRAKLETCAECGKVVPRDREACAACETEFAAPARVGTEIFA